MINVARMRTGAAGEYIGRPSPLGNPFKIGRDGNREEVIAKYRAWIEEQLDLDYGGDWPQTRVQDEYQRLLMIAETRDLTLLCWCAPLACHGDVLKDIMEGDLE